MNLFACFYKIIQCPENPFNNPLQRPYSGDLDPENAYRKPPVILKIRQKTAFDQQIMAYIHSNGNDKCTSMACYDKDSLL
jgi:hypothetical protein